MCKPAVTADMQDWGKMMKLGHELPCATLLPIH